MARVEISATFTVRVTNREAIERLAHLLEILDGLQEDLPWKPEIDEAIEHLEFALQRLTAVGS